MASPYGPKSRGYLCATLGISMAKEYIKIQFKAKKYPFRIKD